MFSSWETVLKNLQRLDIFFKHMYSNMDIFVEKLVLIDKINN